MPSVDQLDPKLVALLAALRHRVRRYIVWDSALAIAVVVLAAFWLGVLLDFVPVQLGGTEMPRSARATLLVLTAVLLLAIIVGWLIGRLRRPLPDESLALLIERHHPDLGGRLVTAVQLNRPHRQGDHHSPVLLRRVHKEAAAMVGVVETDRVFRWQPLIRKLAIAGPLALAVLLLAVLSPGTFVHAASRLSLWSDDPWPRRADLEMVGVDLPVISADGEANEQTERLEFEARRIRLPRGSNGSLRIRARADDAVVPSVCTVYFRTDSGTRGQSNMRRVGRVVDGYQSFLLDGPPLAGLSESMTLDIRGLDDRLDDYRIDAVEPPAITELKIASRYPDYLREPGSADVDLSTEYRAGLRLREGSDVTLIIQGSVPLGEIDRHLQSDAGVVTPDQVQFSDDRRVVQLLIRDFDSTTTIRLVPRDEQGISAQAPYRYFLGVITDEPPELKVQLQGIGSAVTPIARIPLTAEASDDYGIADFTLTASATSVDGSTAEASQSPALDREGAATAVIDLRDLTTAGEFPELAPGAAIKVYGEASDAYDLAGQHLTRSEVFRLQVVTPEQLLALLERRELALRGRLEQTIDETRGLRDSLDMLRRRGFGPTAVQGETEGVDRQLQIQQLRVQQASLQADKTSEEISGIAASLSDLLEEMVNNRVDSVDRRERIGAGVRDPLMVIVDGPLDLLKGQIGKLGGSLKDPATADQVSREATETAELVLLQLTAILEKMLDLESYNEILDIVRGLIDDQDKLRDETETEQKQRILDLFD